MEHFGEVDLISPIWHAGADVLETVEILVAPASRAEERVVMRKMSQEYYFFSLPYARVQEHR